MAIIGENVQVTQREERVKNRGDSLLLCQLLCIAFFCFIIKTDIGLASFFWKLQLAFSVASTEDFPNENL